MKPTVYMMLGLPGSGKTTYSKQLEKKLGARRFSLDEEYFALVGNAQQEHRDFEVERQVGEQIKRKLTTLLASGQSVVLDFCPWRKPERDQYRKFIEAQGADCHVVYFDVSKQELRTRLEERNKQADSNLQYMTPEMLEDFYNRFDPPEDEQVETIKG